MCLLRVLWLVLAGHPPCVCTARVGRTLREKGLDPGLRLGVFSDPANAMGRMLMVTTMGQAEEASWSRESWILCPPIRSSGLDMCPCLQPWLRLSPKQSVVPVVAS